MESVFNPTKIPSKCYDCYWIQVENKFDCLKKTLRDPFDHPPL